MKPMALQEDGMIYEEYDDFYLDSATLVLWRDARSQRSWIDADEMATMLRLIVIAATTGGQKPLVLLNDLIDRLEEAERSTLL
jgi:hypothetical protein